MNFHQGGFKLSKRLISLVSGPVLASYVTRNDLTSWPFEIRLNMTALAVALFEWLSPFGLNPWGRQRTKNFSIASALWVVWGRLFSHLVAFKVSLTSSLSSRQIQNHVLSSPLTFSALGRMNYLFQKTHKLNFLKTILNIT